MNDSRTVYVLERRNPDGSLDFKGEQPPFLHGTFDDITNHYFRHNPGVESASQEAIVAWFGAKGWTWRAAPWAGVRTQAVRGRGIIAVRCDGCSR